MSLTKDQVLKNLVIENLVYYDAPVHEIKVQMFSRELSDLDVEAVSRAFSDFRKEKGRRQMPMPSDIRSRIKPEICSDKSLATEAAARILTAIARFGHNNLEQAREFVGQIGWAVVTMQGGWEELCRSVGDSVPTSVAQSQWIRLAESMLEMGRSMTREEKGRGQQITHVQNQIGLQNLGDQLKKFFPDMPTETTTETHK